MRPSVLSDSFISSRGKPREFTVYNCRRRGKVVIARRYVITDKLTARPFQLLIQYAYSVTERVAVRLRVSASEECDLFRTQVSLFQHLHSVVPIVLQLSATPSRCTQYQYVIFLYHFSGQFGSIVYVVRGDTQLLCDCMGYTLGSTCGRTIKYSNFFSSFLFFNFSTM